MIRIGIGKGQTYKYKIKPKEATSYLWMKIIKKSLLNLKNKFLV